MKRTLVLTTALIFTASIGYARINTDALVADYQAQGYTRVEVKTGLTQTKVEAIRGTEKLEVIYDSTTGAVLKSEFGSVDAGDDTAPGVEIDRRNRDFVRFADRNDNSDDDDDDKDDDDDDNSGHGGGDDDDDDHDDDHGGSGDDDDDDDNSGSGNDGDSDDD